MNDNQVLEKISLDRNTFAYEEASLFGKGLTEAKKLKSLLFYRCNFLDINAVKVIAEAFSQNDTIESLMIANCRFADGGLALWLEALTSHTKLELLNLEYCWLGVDEIDSLAGLISKSNSLLYLKLAWNSVTRGVEIEKSLEANHLSPCIDAICQSKTLLYFGVSGKIIRKKEIDALGKMLKKSTSLRSLCLSWNQLDDPSEIFEALLENTSLSYLDLSNNHAGDSVVESFALCLPQMQGLRKANLRGNHFSVSCLHTLLSALKKNSIIESLDLPTWTQTDERFEHWTSINRGGRQFLAIDNAHASLLPFVLERANTIRYYGNGNKWKEPMNEWMRPNVVYSILRGSVQMII